MRRAEIEDVIQTQKGKITSKIESDPIPAFLFGIVVGILLTVFRAQLLPLLLLGALVTFLFWFFSDDDVSAEKTQTTDSAKMSKPKRNSAEAKTAGTEKNGTSQPQV